LRRKIKDKEALWLLKEIIGSYEKVMEFRERERESLALRANKEYLLAI